MRKESVYQKFMAISKTKSTDMKHTILVTSHTLNWIYYIHWILKRTYLQIYESKPIETLQTKSE